MTLAAGFDATLTVAPEQTHTARAGTVGLMLGYRLGTTNRAWQAEVSQMSRTISDDVSYVALGVPSGFRGRFLAIQPTSEVSFDVRITYATTGAVEHEQHTGLMLMEASALNPFENLEIRGQVTVSWVVGGSES